MGDLISRQAAIDALGHMMDTDGFMDGWAVSRANVDCMLRALPSAQPEIIRCKDCKFWKKYGYINGKPKFLPKCGFNDIYMRENDFCSKGEKR